MFFFWDGQYKFYWHLSVFFCRCLTYRRSFLTGYLVSSTISMQRYGPRLYCWWGFAASRFSSPFLLDFSFRQTAPCSIFFFVMLMLFITLLALSLSSWNDRNSRRQPWKQSHCGAVICDGNVRYPFQSWHAHAACLHAAWALSYYVSSDLHFMVMSAWHRCSHWIWLAKLEIPSEEDLLLCLSP